MIGKTHIHGHMYGEKLLRLFHAYTRSVARYDAQTVACWRCYLNVQTDECEIEGPKVRTTSTRLEENGLRKVSCYRSICQCDTCRRVRSEDERQWFFGSKVDVGCSEKKGLSSSSEAVSIIKLVQYKHCECRLDRGLQLVRHFTSSLGRTGLQKSRYLTVQSLRRVSIEHNRALSLLSPTRTQLSIKRRPLVGSRSMEELKPARKMHWKSLASGL